MPIYEFVCQACGIEFEQIQSFSESSMPACVQCQSTEVVRRMGRPAIHFKGSGWYINDSKKSNDNQGSGKNNGDSSESKATDKATDKAEDKSQSKTESKSENTTGNTSDNGSGNKSDSNTKSESNSTPTSAPAPVASD